MQIFDVMVSGRSQLAQVGRGTAYFIKNIKCEGKPRLRKHRGQVQYRVGAAAQGHVAGHGIAHGLFRDDVPGTQVAPDQFQNLHSGFFGQSDARGRNGGNGAVARQGQPNGFRQTVHGVRREHAGTGAAAGAGAFFHFAQFSLVDEARAQFAHSFKNAVEIGVVVACQHGAAADDDGRNVQAQRGHEHAGHAFVTVGNEHEPVKRMGRGHNLYGVSDNFPRGQ